MIDGSAGPADACTVRMRRPLLAYLVAKLGQFRRGQAAAGRLLLAPYFVSLRGAMRFDGTASLGPLFIIYAKKVTTPCITCRDSACDEKRNRICNGIHGDASVV